MPEAASGDTPSLKVENVSKRFSAGKVEVHALDDVSFDIRPGSVTGLIGPDAAGKTTLIRTIAGLLVPDKGRITVLDIDVAADPLKVQQTIGYMPQRFGLYQELTVRENLDLYADLQGVPVSDRKSRYEELMHMTGLGRFTRRFARDLSGGMKQKLGLACTLVRPPRMLLLDEPTVGVDPVSRRELWQIIYRLVEEEGITVLLSTAYLDEAERCDRVVLMHQGKLLGQGPPAQFSREVAGRSFQVTAESMNKRVLQTRLADADGVVDAIIQKNGVRLVMEKAAPPEIDTILAEENDATVEEVTSRFEDAFIVRLRERIGPSGRSRIDTGKTVDGKEGEEIIAVDNVKRRFGDFYAVKGISFAVRRGEVFGLLGANGAGKSTTFRMLCGLLPPSEGSLQVAGRDLLRAAASARSRIGYMAQKFSLYGDLSVMENLRFFSSVYGLQRKKQKDRIDWAVNEFELEEYANAPARNLPLGFKQRLAMAAALMHHPEILFLDEPTSGVDPLARREFWHRINSLSEQKVTVLVTTHFMEEAEYCDRLVMMAEGDILAQGTPEEMKDRFRTKETPEPSMEDAFIGLVRADEEAKA